MPTCDLPVTIAPVGEDTPLAGVELSMDTLATAGVDALRAGLAPLVDGYLRWLADREAEVGDLPVSLRAAAEAAVFNARRAAARIRAGINLLATHEADRHDQALAAFRFANEAMALQRRHTETARLREETGLPYQEAKARVDGRGAAVASWRPFQLAFVLLNLPSLTDPEHPERAADRDATVDLLFFPTGGGKTEAYLGLTAFTFAIRRLQGTAVAGPRRRGDLHRRRTPRREPPFARHRRPPCRPRQPSGAADHRPAAGQGGGGRRGPGARLPVRAHRPDHRPVERAPHGYGAAGVPADAVTEGAVDPAAGTGRRWYPVDRPDGRHVHARDRERDQPAGARWR
jgi:hypothetical protein